jgi:adenylate cyclase
MEVERLYEIIKDLRLTPNSYGFITDQYGTAIAHADKEKILKANFFRDVEIAEEDAQKVREDTSGLLKYTYEGHRKHFFFKKIPETGWIVAYTIPVKDLYLEVNKMMYFTIGVSVIVIVISVLAALILSRRITSPLDKIITGVEKVKTGNFDFKLDLKTGDEFQLFSETFNEMVESLKERDLVKEAFGKYVSNQVLDEILNGKVALGGEMKNITVLFSDIRDFTKLSSKMEPAKVVKFLNDYFSSMVDVVFKHGGSIDKFLGDGLMALFGAPISYHDSARRAVDAAIEMRIKLSEINVRRELEGENPIDIGVSLHTGECIVGNIGTQQKMEYTAVGDVVNITSRLEELNKEFKTHVIITEATYQHVADFVKVRPLPEVQIRGRSEAIRIYEVLSKKPTA